MEIQEWLHLGILEFLLRTCWAFQRAYGRDEVWFQNYHSDLIMTIAWTCYSKPIFSMEMLLIHGACVDNLGIKIEPS